VYAAVALLLHLVLLLRRRGRRATAAQGAIAAGAAAIAFAPYWAGWQTFRGILKIADMSNKSLAGTVQRALVYVFRFVGVSAARDDAAAVIRWVTFPLLLGAVLWAVLRLESEEDVWTGTLAVLAAYVLVTPWYLPWYLVAPLALVAVLPRNRLTVPLLT